MGEQQTNRKAARYERLFAEVLAGGNFALSSI
jgi:hypothetical protein